MLLSSCFFLQMFCFAPCKLCFGTQNLHACENNGGVHLAFPTDDQPHCPSSPFCKILTSKCRAIVAFSFCPSQQGRGIGSLFILQWVQALKCCFPLSVPSWETLHCEMTHKLFYFFSMAVGAKALVAIN